MRIYRIRKFPTKLFFLILIIVIIGLNPKTLSGFRNFFFAILSKPFKVLSDVKTYFIRAKYLSEENLLLKQRLADLSLTLARMKERLSESERLHHLLDFKESLRYKTIAAKVIARDSLDWRRAIIIDKGEKDGIREHMPCATSQGLIGRVVEAGPTSSKIMLITDPSSRVGVILEPSREHGVLIGSPQGACKVIYLSMDGKINKGDRVLTAGLSALLPKGLAIGEVTMTDIEKANLYRYAIVDPFEDMNKIEEVVCIDVEE